MKEVLERFVSQRSARLQDWALQRIFGVFVFNTVLVLLLLLHSAGYFSPYFPLTINTIVVIGMILSILLLRMNSKDIFFLALFFWLLAAFLKTVGIDVWAERSAIYSFEALLIGIILLIIESNLLTRQRRDE